MSSISDSFKDQVVVITGASSGIGKAVALDIAGHGSVLHLLGRSQERLASVLSQCQERGAKQVKVYPTDVTNDGALQKTVEELKAALPRVDVLIHSAGVVTLGRLESAPTSHLDLNYQINLRAPVTITRELLGKIVLAQGQVVFINSGAGLAAKAEWGHYAASKHGLKAIADSLREEVKSRGVRVLTVYPGRTATPMQERVRTLEGAPYNPEDFIQPQDVSTMLLQALALSRTADVAELNIRPGKAHNPLLDIELEVPFDKICASHVEPAITRLLKTSRDALDQIIAVEGERTYDNTLGALDESTDQLEVVMTVVGHLESVATTPELREVYNRVKPEVSAFYARIPLDEGLWQALCAYAETAEAKSLTGEKKRFLKKTLDDFRRHGAELEQEGKERLEAITRELAELTAKFSQNLLDATAAYELIITEEEQLKGLPPSAVDAARQSAEQKDKEGWRFTLQAPSMIPLLTYLDDASIREEIYRQYNTRATSGDLANPPLIARILSLRREQAALLDFPDFSDLVLEDRMAEKGEKASDFVSDLAERARAAFLREHEELIRFRQQLEGEDAQKIRPWDIAYYAEKQRQALFEFDDEVLRPYFSAERVLEGLFDTAHRLYGITVRLNPERAVWHEDVRAYDMVDEDGGFLGPFYVDLYPREEKRGGAWMNGIISGVHDGTHSEPHLGLICANVTPPVKDRPALLTHEEVTTLFHEFGHLLHHMLSRVSVRGMAGTNVAWDFVELPSQIMENWCWERSALDLFAQHYQTNERIPSDLFQKMQRARTYREGTATMRQLGFATVDLTLHREYDPERHGDVVIYSRDILQRFAPAPYPEEYAFIAGFGHLFSSAVGYAAGYYSYKWAEVLDADAFTRFQQDGVFSRVVGEAFRTSVLERGDGEDPMTLYKTFMGREPSLDALLIRSGLVETSSGE